MRRLLALVAGLLVGGAGPVLFTVGDHRFAVPAAYLRPDLAGTGAPQVAIMDLTVQWPGFGPAPVLDYRGGMMSVAVQDVSATSPVEALRTVAGPDRARFLRLWRDSTVEQMALREDVALAGARWMAPPSGVPGLRELSGAQPSPDRPHIHGDGGQPGDGVLMACDDESSCQLWWLRGDAAVEVTFDVAQRLRWQEVQDGVAALLTRIEQP